MERKHWIGLGYALTAFAALAVFIALRSGQDAAAPVGRAIGSGEPVNLLIITLDDWGVDKASSYQHDAYGDYGLDATALPRTKNIDALAAAGVRFTDAWANPTCSPTRAAMQTGRHAFRTGIGKPVGIANTPPLARDVSTLADLVHGAGYTAGVFGKWHLGQAEPPEEWGPDDLWEDHLDEQFDVVMWPMELGYDTFIGALEGKLDVLDGQDYYAWTRVAGRLARRDGTAIANEETTWAPSKNVDDTLMWIGKQAGPWLAVVNFNAPHTPLQAPPEGCHHADQAWTPSGDLELYQAMVECTDVLIAELLDGLDDLDDLDQTLVVVVGDNGTEDVAEGLFKDGRGKGTIYESGVRVPLIVADGAAWRAGGSRASPVDPLVVVNPGEEIADPVHVVDFYATVAELVGADGQSGADSVSMLPLIAGTAGPIRDAIYNEEFGQYGGSAALRVGSQKLIVHVEITQGAGCRSGYELYDLYSDRFEDDSLVDDKPRGFDVMRKRLDDYVAAEGVSWLDVPDCDV